jgi:membrane-associated phospholipid phosphatase
MAKTDQLHRLTKPYSLWTVILVLMALFALLFTLVWQGRTQTWDEEIMRRLYASSTPTMHRIFQFIADTGGIGRGIPLIIALLWFWIKGRRLEAWTSASAAAGAQLLIWTIKAVVNRPRPIVFQTVEQPTDASFPSGHATGSIAVYGWLAFWLWRQGYRIPGGLLFVWAILIGFSRVYLGVHYPTDVLASWTLGLAWLLTVIVVYSRKKEVQQ